MSGIKRTNESGTYRTTAGWLKNFVEKFAKTAPIAPPFVVVSTEKFATIEDKMLDIKARVGFGLLSAITKESNEQVIVVASEKCKCGKDTKDCTCKQKKAPSKERKAALQNILKYITDMIQSEPHLLKSEILSRCTDNSDLVFESARIRISELEKFIDEQKSKTPSNIIDVKYSKPGVNQYIGSAEDAADYYQHGTPSAR